MIRLLVPVALVVLMSAPFGASAADPKCCVPIKLDVTPQWTTRGLELAIRLTNTGKKPLRFSKGSGPWVGPEQIRLVAITLPWGEPIVNKEQALLDPHLGLMELAPGKAEHHSVLIENIYPELAAELLKGKTDVVLFWTYQLSTADLTQSERVGGWLSLPAKSPGPKDRSTAR
jgi:hypothetical protein